MPLEDANKLKKYNMGFVMMKKYFLPIIIVLGVISLIILIFTFNLMKGLKLLKHYENTGFFQTMTVETAPLKTSIFQSTVNTIGNMKAVQGTSISTQVAGKITKIYFQSGNQVKKGDELLELDHKEISAQLDGAKAQHKLNEINYKRDYILYKKDMLQRSKIDQDIEQIKSSQSQIDQLQAQINYHIITAPFSGALGIRQVSIGDYISPGTAITTLNTVDPIYINFTLTQQQLSFIKIGQKIKITISSFPNQIFTGKISSIDNQISDDTKGINIQATVQNDMPNKTLLPNMFANITISIGQPKTSFVVPENAVQYSLYGTSIYIVDNKLQKFKKPTAKQIYVTPGERKNGMIAIKSDKLKLNDEVIVLGGHKITENNEPIKIIDSNNKSTNIK